MHKYTHFFVVSLFRDLFLRRLKKKPNEIREVKTIEETGRI